MKKLFAFIVVLCLFFCVVIPVLAGEAPLSAREGVLRVYGEAYGTGLYNGSYYQNELLSGWTGSAFAVSKETNGSIILITNRHCVDSEYGDEEMEAFANNGLAISNVIYIVNDDADHMVQAEVIAISKKTDLALIRVKNLKNRSVQLKIWAGDPLKIIQNTVYTAGFPGASDDIKSEKAQNKLQSDINSVTFADGKVSRVIEAGQTEYGEIIQHTALTNNGNSGGPLLDEDGNVVGVNTWGTNRGEQTYWSISNRELISFLKDNKISYKEGTKVKKVDPAIIAIVLAALLAVILLVAIIRMRRVAQAQGRQIDEILRKRLNQFTTVFLPKSKPISEPGKNNQLSHSDDTGRILRCDHGALAGRDFTLKSKLVIGRDPACCDVVFPKDATGVSRIHCTICYTERSVTVRDENSSYGTFMDGKRIAAGVDVPFHRGHKLGIGSAGEQVFSLHSIHLKQ